jgi:hypothetical protein
MLTPWRPRLVALLVPAADPADDNPPRVAAESFFSSGAFSEASGNRPGTTAHARLSGVVLRASRRTCSLTGRSSASQRLRAAASRQTCAWGPPPNIPLRPSRAASSAARCPSPQRLCRGRAAAAGGRERSPTRSPPASSGIPRRTGRCAATTRGAATGPSGSPTRATGAQVAPTRRCCAPTKAAGPAPPPGGGPPPPPGGGPAGAGRVRRRCRTARRHPALPGQPPSPTCRDRRGTGTGPETRAAARGR